MKKIKMVWEKRYEGFEFRVFEMDIKKFIKGC